MTKTTKVWAGILLALAFTALVVMCITSLTMESAKAKDDTYQVVKSQNEDYIFLGWKSDDDMIAYTIQIDETEEQIVDRRIEKIGFPVQFQGQHVVLKIIKKDGTKILIYDDEI